MRSRGREVAIAVSGNPQAPRDFRKHKEGISTAFIARRESRAG